MKERYLIRLFQWRQESGAESKPAQIKFSPRLMITREVDWKSLELLLVNRSRWTVWVEEANVVLAELDTYTQAAVPTWQARHQILQNVRPNEVLTVDIAATIYDAAGMPQGPFSCLVQTNVLYRVFNEWCTVSGWRRLP